MSPNPHQLPSPPSIISPQSIPNTQTPTSTHIPPSLPLPQPSPEQSKKPHSLSNVTTPLHTLPPPSPSISPQWSQTPKSLSDISSPEILSDESDDNFGIPIEQPPSRPMVNFAHDTELEEDYEIGWQWHEQDLGPLVTPYTGFRQCLLDPTKQKPEDFFNALFGLQMYTIITKEINRYAQQKIQRGKFLTKYLFISNQCKTFFQDSEIIYVTRSNSFLLKQCFLCIEIKKISVYITKTFQKYKVPIYIKKILKIMSKFHLHNTNFKIIQIFCLHENIIIMSENY